MKQPLRLSLLPTVSSRHLSPFACARRRLLSTPPPSAPKPSLLDSAADLLSTLRWKAAQALTSSLPAAERARLLENYQPPAAPPSPSQDDSSTLDPVVPAKTVAEAVAEARAAEARIQSAKWSKEKASIMEEAEKAAKARVETDLALHIRRLEVERLEAEKAARPEVGQGLGTHPVLGPVVADFGTKRVHVVSAGVLTSIPVWEEQRIYRHERAKAMATDKAKTLHLGLPGVIALHEDRNGKLSILDGQHRVGMMSILEQKHGGALDTQRILVEVFPQHPFHSDSHATELFTEVNKAEPVKLVDMPGVAKASDRKIITESAGILQQRFPQMFSASQNCRAPHLNVDNLRDALFASNVIGRHGIKSSKVLEEWMMEQNRALGEKYEGEEARKKVAKTAMAKALKFGFFLGLESSWLYD